MSSVSVVIPTYNDSKHLSRAIDSVLKQTLDVNEIIVIDDASADNPEAVLERYDDDRLQFKRHDTNQGGSAARNTGIKIATGEYIAFLDADDEWLPPKLERQLKILESRADDWVAVHCDREYDFSFISKAGYVLSRAIGATKRDPPKEGGEELVKEILLMNLSTGASTLVVKRDIVEKIGGFDPEFPRHQDWEFLIRVLQEGKLAHADEPLVIKHGTGRPSATVHNEAKELLLSKFSGKITRLEQNGYNVSTVQNQHLAKLYIEEGNFREGINHISIRSNSLVDFLSLAWSFLVGISDKICN